MASIRPLRGLRFADSQRLDSLIAPPYDVLSPDQRDAYAAKSPHNIVHLTLPESKPDDRSKYIKYARSAASLAEWRREGVLALEPQPALYLYRQRFRVAGYPDERERASLIALLRLEPFEAGIVLPHERTFPKHKEDRLRVLEATRAHLETIFGLYEDAENEVAHILSAAPSADRVEAYDDGVHHSLTVVTDAIALARVTEILAAKKIWIADGHHRYETALTFRAALHGAEGEVPEDYIPIALASMSDPGLVLLPTHRIVKTYPGSRDEILSRLSTRFELTPSSGGKLAEAIHGRPYALGLVLSGGESFVVTPNDPEGLFASMNPESSEALRRLDVSILHDGILSQALGVIGVDGLEFTRDEPEAIAAASNGAAMVWLMNPPTVDDMKIIALGGERMPQKSTYYFPKIQSGLVLWSLNDF